MSPTTIPLSVKWNKQVIDFDFDTSTGVSGLKQQLQDRTSVPVDRMKLMAKTKNLWKGVLKDSDDDAAIDWQAAYSKNKNEPLSMLLMGSAVQLSEPAKKTVFVEDLPPEQVAKIQEPSGLVNLGNTCYLNSVVQCLRIVPPFRQVLKDGSNNALLPRALSDTLTQLDRQSQALQPFTLVQATKMAIPQFNQTGPHGQPLQQDAEEFYSNLLQSMATAASSSANYSNPEQIAQLLAGLTKSNSNGVPLPPGITNVVDGLLGLKLQETLTCQETDQEPPVVTYDWHRKLVCNIQGGSDSSQTTNVNHIYDGLQLSLSGGGNVEKHSSILNRNALWQRRQEIARLPPLLTIQFGRFYWKATPDSQDHAGVKCKVMKPVAFGGTLDLYDYCNDEIKAVLKKSRQAALLAEEARVQAKLTGNTTAADGDAEMTDASNSDNNNKSDNGGSDEVEDAELQAALAMSLEADNNDTSTVTTAAESAALGPGLPPNFQGHYELFGVVTHKGRDADGGHYMAWVKADNPSSDQTEKIADTDEDNENWYVFDDDEVSPCKTEDVLKLKGGGDWHMSYLNFYRAKR